MLTLIGTALSSILAGGATGILGGGLQRFFDWLHEKEVLKQKQADQAFELEKRRIDVQITQAEWAGRTRVAETEAGAAKDVAESNASAASLVKEPERYSESGMVTHGQNWLLVLLDIFRGAVRPGLTLYLGWITTRIYDEAKAILDAHGAALSTDQALNLVNNIVATILYLFTTCVLWYFGTRNRQKPPVIKGG